MKPILFREIFMIRRTFILLAALAGLAASIPAMAGHHSKHAVLYKNPSCGCCEEYADYLRKDGYTVNVVPTHDLDQIKRERGVPESLDGCHTTLVGDYVVEGHVPLKTLNRLLVEKPKITGISLPGMPQGSPGMSGRKAAPFTIYAISKDQPRVFATE